jgi:hypothetical protein
VTSLLEDQGKEQANGTCAAPAHQGTRGPRDKIIARLAQPYMESNSPDTLSMIASNFKCYQYYTFKRGRYWDEVPLKQGPEAVLSGAEFSHVRAFILDHEDQQKPEIAPWLRWLEANAVEKTGELNSQLGSNSEFRLIVR